MKTNDIYVHSDVAGSGSCLIKNDSGLDITPSTIQEAGSFVVCNTKAWLSSVSDKAWWVYANQVSKTTQPGEYVTTGSFIIRGKKNYIVNTKLELGLGILFKTDSQTDLVENPGEKETILFGVPECGTYSSFKKYKYKVKIIPGNLKTGKAVKKIVQKLLQQSKKSIDYYCIKQIPLDCFNKVMVNKVLLV